MGAEPAFIRADRWSFGPPAPGLVRRRQGRERIWEQEPKRLDDAHRHLDRISRQWDEALGRLKAFVER